MAAKKLYRSCSDVMVGGVAAGVAEYLEIDVTLIRLVFLVLLFSGVGFFAYLVAWIIVPLDPKCKEHKTGAEEIKEKAESIASEINEAVSKKQKSNKKNNDFSIWFGVILVFLGGLILIQNITGMNVWHYFFPVSVMLIGLLILMKSVDK